MALSASALKTLLRAELILGGALDNAATTGLAEAIANAVVTHITTSAVVTVPLGVAVQVTPATGTGATIAPGVGVIS